LKCSLLQSSAEFLDYRRVKSLRTDDYWKNTVECRRKARETGIKIPKQIVEQMGRPKFLNFGIELLRADELFGCGR
jgi:hypothetical protein